MLGSEIIEYIENKFNVKEGFNWLEWCKVKQDIYPDREYPHKDMKLSWVKLRDIIKEEKIKKSLEDIC